MLNEQDFNYVVVKLVSYLGQQSHIRAVGVAGLAPEVQALVPEAFNPQQFAKAILEVCINDAWTRNPPSLAVLLGQIAVTDEKIQAIVLRIGNPPATPTDPTLATMLSSGMPFLDRDQLRAKLRAFGSASLKPILVVNGDPRSGRSYTNEFVMHYWSHSRQFTPCYARVSSKSTEPDQLARDLVTQVGGTFKEMPELQRTTVDRWPNELANWVLTEAYSAATKVTPNRKFWFVIDGFAKTKKKSVRDLAVHLAEKICTGVYPELFRLILLEFDRSALTVQVGRVSTDETRLVTDAEVLTCARSIMALDPTLTQADAEAVEKRLLDGVSSGAQRNEELNKRLADLYAASQPS